MHYLLLALFSLGLFAHSPAALAEDPPAADEVVAPADEAPTDAAPAEESAAEVEAEEAPTVDVDEDAAEVAIEMADEAGLLVEALNSKSWPVAFGLFLTILVAVVRKFGLKDKLPSQYVPWASIALAVAATVGASLTAGVAAGEALVSGLTAGLAAIGGWEALFKHVGVLKGPEAPAA